MLNIEKKTVVTLNHLLNSKLSKYLKGKTLFFWLHVFTIENIKLLMNQTFCIHLKAKNQITVKGEDTKEVN